MSADLAMRVFSFILRGVSLLGVNSVDIPIGDRLLAWQKLAQDWKLDLSSDLVSECSLEELSPKIDQILKGGIRGRIVVNSNSIERKHVQVTREQKHRGLESYSHR